MKAAEEVFKSEGRNRRPPADEIIDAVRVDRIESTPVDYNCEKTAENLVEVSIYLSFPFHAIAETVNISVA